jgi:hypothetical protein
VASAAQSVILNAWLANQGMADALPRTLCSRFLARLMPSVGLSHCAPVFSLMPCERRVLDATMGRGGRGAASGAREVRQRLTGGAEMGRLESW